MYSLLKPLLFLLPEEAAHSLALYAAKIIGFLHRLKLIPKPHYNLQIQTPFGEISAPLGLAAGCDKNALALWGWQAMGFGFVEVGTATPLPQPGNPKPRLFRFPTLTALVNRLGFNNEGAEKISKRIQKAKKQGLKIKVGGNIGKNFSTPLEKAAEDYKKAAALLTPNVDYLVINVSSPNTPGLRSMQNADNLKEIILAVQSVSNNKPLFVKVAPDDYKTFFDGICALVKIQNLAGVICGNTLAGHDASLPQGGLSGKPVFTINLELATAYAAALPDKFVIGVGGIVSETDAPEYFKAGAKAVQIYTGLVYNGPGFIKRILKKLV